MQFLTYLFGLLLQFTEPPSLGGDTGEDTSLPVDTGSDSSIEETDPDSATVADCSDLDDTACEDALKSAMDLAGENGGFGCSALGASSATALWASVLMIGLRRKE